MLNRPRRLRQIARLRHDHKDFLEVKRQQDYRRAQKGHPSYCRLCGLPGLRAQQGIRAKAEENLEEASYQGAIRLILDAYWRSSALPAPGHWKETVGILVRGVPCIFEP